MMLLNILMVRRISPEQYFKEKAIEEIKTTESIYKFVKKFESIDERLVKNIVTHAVSFLFGFIVGYGFGRGKL